mmetsp:Transcript_7854/g.18507  ORF Transcript_7854/g.18507 Transcript_7854/m.18507 type:complete len:381 (+) Transcript_7854:346-1488(+)
MGHSHDAEEAAKLEQTCDAVQVHDGFGLALDKRERVIGCLPEGLRAEGDVHVGVVADVRQEAVVEEDATAANGTKEHADRVVWILRGGRNGTEQHAQQTCAPQRACPQAQGAQMISQTIPASLKESTPRHRPHVDPVEEPELSEVHGREVRKGVDKPAFPTKHGDTKDTTHEQHFVWGCHACQLQTASAEGIHPRPARHQQSKHHKKEGQYHDVAHQRQKGDQFHGPALHDAFASRLKAVDRHLDRVPTAARNEREQQPHAHQHQANGEVVMLQRLVEVEKVACNTTAFVPTSYVVEPGGKWHHNQHKEDAPDKESGAPRQEEDVHERSNHRNGRADHERRPSANERVDSDDGLGLPVVLQLGLEHIFQAVIAWNAQDLR